MKAGLAKMLFDVYSVAVGFIAGGICGLVTLLVACLFLGANDDRRP